MSWLTLPEILLLCMDDADIEVFNQALTKEWPEYQQNPKVTPLNENLSCLPADENHTFDLIVSPANSYGRLDGGFDDAISRTFCLPTHSYHAVTEAAQATLYERWRGFAPPGTCTLVTLPKSLQDVNRWKCKYVALCPTMRTPSSVSWDREVVYECVWSLLCEVDAWNNRVDSHDHIRRILITPLATGAGRIPVERWARQFVLAMKHFVDALEKPDRWTRLSWKDLMEEVHEVEATWEENGRI